MRTFLAMFLLWPNLQEDKNNTNATCVRIRQEDLLNFERNFWNADAKKMESDQHYRNMRACKCSIVDCRSDSICYQHVFHYGLPQKVLQFGDFVDGYPQSTHKPSTNSIHKFRSMCFYNTLDLWMATRVK